MSPSLVLRFSTDLEPVKAGLKQLAAQAVPLLGQVSAAALSAGRSFKQLAIDHEASASMIRRGLTLLAEYKAVIIGVGLAAAGIKAGLSAAADQVERLQAIGKGAEAAGVSGTFFQAWTQQLGEMGITADKAAEALVHAREAVRVKADYNGSLAQNSVLDVLGERALGAGHTLGVAYDQFKNSQDVEARIKAVVAAIRELNVEAQKTGDFRLNLVGDKLAGDVFGNADLAKPIRDAQTELDAFKAAGLAAGTILADGLVAQAKDLDDRLQKAGRTLSDDLAPVYNDLAKAGLFVKEQSVEWVESLDKVVGLLGQAYGKLKDINSLLPTINVSGPLAAAAAALGLGADQSKTSADILRAAMAHPDAWTSAADRQRLGTAGGMPVQFPVAGAGTAGLPLVGPTAPVRPPPSVLNAAASAPKAESDSADAVDHYVNQLQKSVDVLRSEIATYGLSNVKKQEAIDLARAEAAARERGEPLTAEETAQILKLADAYGQLKDKQLELRRATANAKQEAEFFGTTLEGALEKAVQPGAKFKDIMAGVVQSLEQAALKAMILGSGPLAGLFGTQAAVGAQGAASVGGLFGMVSGLFATSHAAGGLAGSGPKGFYPAALWQNAKKFDLGGAIPTLTHPGEIILNAAQQKNAAAAMGPGNTVQHFYLSGAVSQDSIMSMIQSASQQTEARARSGARLDRVQDSRRRN